MSLRVLSRIFSIILTLSLLINCKDTRAEENQLFKEEVEVSLGTMLQLVDAGETFYASNAAEEIPISLPVKGGETSLVLIPSLGVSASIPEFSEEFGIYPFSVKDTSSERELGSLTLTHDRNTNQFDLRGIFFYEGIGYNVARANDLRSMDNEDHIRLSIWETYLDSDDPTKGLIQYLSDSSSEKDFSKYSAGTSFSTESSASLATTSSTMKVLKVATEADYEYVLAYGGVAQAKANILAIWNAVDAVIRQDLGIKVQVIFQNAQTSYNQPYPFTPYPTDSTVTDIPVLFNQFVNEWSARYYNTTPYDVAFLHTGKPGNFNGFAYIGSLCSNVNGAYSARGHSYGVVQNGINTNGNFTGSVYVTLNELAHIFNAEYYSDDGILGALRVQRNYMYYSPLGRAVMQSFLNRCTCISSETSAPQPVIISQPQSRSHQMEQNEAVVFGVVANGENLSYQWYENDQPISGATSTTLYIKMTDKCSIGRSGSQYKVQISNSYGTVWSNPATLTVTPRVETLPPPIGAQPSDITVGLGQSATFSATTPGYGLDIQWCKNGSLIPGATGLSYTIPSVSADMNNSKYLIHLTSWGGTTYSRVATLTVQGAPAPTPYIPPTPVPASQLSVLVNNSASTTVNAGGSYTLLAKNGSQNYSGSLDALSIVCNRSNPSQCSNAQQMNNWGTTVNGSITQYLSSIFPAGIYKASFRPAGSNWAWSNQVTITVDNNSPAPNPTIPPSENLPAPTGIAASDGAFTKRITVGWIPVTGATSYKIYRSTILGSAGSLVGNAPVGSSTFTDLGVRVGVYYQYSVSAVSGNGSEGLRSAQDRGYVKGTQGLLKDIKKKKKIKKPKKKAKKH